MGKVSLFIAWDVQLIVEFNKVSGRVNSVKAIDLHLLSSLLLYLLHISVCLCSSAGSHISLCIFHFHLSSHLAILNPTIFTFCVSWPLPHTSPPTTPLNFSSPPSSCYLLSHKIYLRLILLSVCLRDSDCVILDMSQWLKVCMGVCVCVYDYKWRCVQVCVHVCVGACGLVWCVWDRGNWAQRVFCLWWQRGNWNLQNPLERPSHSVCVSVCVCCVSVYMRLCHVLMFV